MKKRLSNCITLFSTLILVTIPFAPTTAAENTYSNYPTGFNGSGSIDNISSSGICINDIMYVITRTTTFNRPGFLNCSRKWFKKKDFVYFILDKKGSDAEKTIKSLWLAINKTDQLERP